MYQFIFTGLLPLVLLYALAFFVNITVHEPGHAIPVPHPASPSITIFIK